MDLARLYGSARYGTEFNLECMNVFRLCNYQLYARLPPSQAMMGNEGEIFFVLLQNVALVVGCLPTPISYKDIYLMVFSSLCEKLCCLHCMCKQWLS